MTPYLQLQLQYALLAGGVTFLLWWWLGLHSKLRTAIRARFALASALLGVLGAIAIGLIRLVDHWQGTSQFIVVALCFYAGVVWLPLCVWNEFARRRREVSLDLLLALVCVALTGGGLYALFLEPNRLQLVENSIQFPEWPPDSEPVRIVHISDLQTVGRCEREARAAAMINRLNPDLIIWTGDYVAGPFGDPDPAVQAAREFLGSLRARLGIVCVAGHSESEKLRQRVFEGFDVLYLRNEAILLDVGEGRTLRIFASTALKPDFSDLLPEEQAATVTLVASHVPDLSWDLVERDVDLHLAGHTHGGQVTLPWIGPLMTLSRLPTEYAKGLHRFGDHWLNVTPGIGMEGNHAPRIRFLCPPEVHLLELRGGGPTLASLPVPERANPWWARFRSSNKHFGSEARFLGR